MSTGSGANSKEASPAKSLSSRPGSADSSLAEPSLEAVTAAKASPAGSASSTPPVSSRSSLERQQQLPLPQSRSSSSSASLSEVAASANLTAAASSASPSAYSTPSPVRLRKRSSALAASSEATVAFDTVVLTDADAGSDAAAALSSSSSSSVVFLPEANDDSANAHSSAAASFGGSLAAADAGETVEPPDQLVLGAEADDEEGTEKGSSTEEEDAGGSSTPCPPSEPYLPGESLVRTLFKQFVRLSQRKVTEFMLYRDSSSDDKRNLAKFFAAADEAVAAPGWPSAVAAQRGAGSAASANDREATLDQVIASLRTVSEHCLPSIVTALFQWYDYQHSADPAAETTGPRSRPVSGAAASAQPAMSEKDIAVERKDLAVDYLFCLVLIQVLEHISGHPGYQEMVDRILNQCFSHFKQKEDTQTRPNAANLNLVADMYASVVGVLAKYRFAAVRKKFWTELRQLRSRELNLFVTRNIKSLLMGMKCLRVQMAPIDDLEAGATFVHELAVYFNEVKDKEIRHSLAGLLVEILLPVAAVAKNEVNIPAMRQIVDTLWNPCNELATKKKHSLALFPLVTCLLCVSQKQFFLSHWPYFLSMCLSHLKSRDPQMARISLDSVFRLLWVYMIRIRGEKHSETQSRLQSIVLSIFPKGSKLVIPKETPINIFVRIINLIAQEKFDFAIKEIIFELLCVNRPKMIMPERMNIGLRAFLSIVHALQQKEEPAMLLRTADLGTIKVKKSLIASQITDDTGKNLGIQSYLPQIRKSFVSIIRQLDPVVGRALMLTKVDADEQAKTAEERKQKLDLLKTCLSAIPRLLPNREDMRQSELVEFLTRLLIHIDAEVKQMVQAALQTLVHDFADWRAPVVRGLIDFVRRELADSLPDLFDSALLSLAKLLQHWEKASGGPTALNEDQIKALHKTEGLALIAMCQPRLDQSQAQQLKPSPRKLGVAILKAARSLLSQHHQEPNLLDQFEKYLAGLRLEEEYRVAVRQDRPSITAHDFISCLEGQRTDLVWYPGPEQPVLIDDPWVRILTGFLLEQPFGSLYSLRAAWSYGFDRLSLVFQYVDPNSPQSQRASSLLRSGSRPPGADREQYIHLWQNYVVLCCTLCPDDSAAASAVVRPAARQDKRGTRDLVKLLVPLLKCDLTDLKTTVIGGLGRMNAKGFRECLDELVPLMREACDKSDKVRRKKRRDTLKSCLLRLLDLAARTGCLRLAESGARTAHGSLIGPLLDFIEGVRQILEKDDSQEALELRRHLCDFLANLIGPADQEARARLLGPGGQQLRVDLFRTVSTWLPSSLSPLMAPMCSGEAAAAAAVAAASAAAAAAAAAALAAASHSPPPPLPPLSSSSSSSMPTAQPPQAQPLPQSSSLSLSSPSAPLPVAADSTLVEANLATVRCLLALLASGPGLERDPRTGELGIGDIRLPRLTAWLDGLLACRPAAQLAQDTVCQLLLLLLAHDSEQDVRDLLDWLVHRCYTAPVGTPAYIRVILSVFTAQPDFPCYDTVMLCLALLFSGLPDPGAAQQASHLFQLLYHRFYLEGKDASNEREAFYRRIPCLRAEALSAEFAVLHAQDLTMSVFSELTRRCEEARPPLKQIIFRLLLPWLRPIELSLDRDALPATSGGYGSIEASEMILNNLLVLTHQIGDLFPYELEAIWQGLVRSSSDHSNLKTIIRYILAVTSLSPDALLPTARRIAVYALRKEPRSTVDELLAELRCLDDRGSWSVERLPSRPYIKYSDRGPVGQQIWSDKYATLRACPAPKPLDMPPYGGHFANLDRYLTQEEVLSAEQFFHCSVALLLTGDLVQDRPDVDWRGYSGPSRVELKRLPTLLHACVLAMDHGKPRVHLEARLVLLQLCTVLYPASDVFRHALLSLRGSPVGEVAIKASPSLTTLTPDQSQPDQRVSAYLVEGGGARQLTDLLTREPSKPLFLRDDAYLQSRACACSVAGVVASSNAPSGPSGGIGASASAYSLAELVQLLGSTLGESVDWADYALVAGLSCASRHYAGRSLQVFRALGQPLSMARLGDLTQRLIETVSEPGEDQCYVRELLLTLDSCVRFANCPPASLLHQQQQQQQHQRTHTSHSQSSTKAGGGDAAAMAKSTIELPLRQSPLQQQKQQHQNQHLQQQLIDEADPQQQHIRSTSYTAGISHGSPAHHHGHVTASASAAPAAAGLSGSSASKHHRAVTVTDLSYTKEASALASSSGSAGALARRLANQADERFSVLWWISVCLLESDVENELILSLRILGQLLDRLQEQHQPPRLRFEWPDYPGLVRLLGRACCPSAPALIEPAFAVMCRLPRLLMSPVTEPRGAESGYASLTLQLLPYLLLHYDNSPQHAREAAARLGTFGQDSWPDATCQLSVVLAQYSRNSFTRDASQWCRCVCRYLCDAFPSLGPALVRQALGQLESWPSGLLPHSQAALHALLSNVDLTEEVARPLVHILTRQIAHGCGDTMRLHAILKHLVFKSASVPPASHTKHPLVQPLVPLPEAEPPRRELPGRTLNFTFDVRSEDRIGGAGQPAPSSAATQPLSTASTASMASAVSAPPAVGINVVGSSARSAADTPSLSSSDSGSGGEKRSLASGSAGHSGHGSGGAGGTGGIGGIGDRHLPHVPRVRIRLVALCAGYFGARAGLPKSPSDAYWHKRFANSTARRTCVIFSQSTETIDRQGSVHSSSDTTSTNEQTDDLLLEDSSSSELRYYNIVGFIDDQLGFLNIEDPDSPTHPGHVKLNWGVGSVPIYSDSYGDAASDKDAAASPSARSRQRRDEESSSSSSDDEEEELVAALPQREPATGASLSPSSAPSTSPQEEPPGPGELEWQEFASKASSLPSDRLGELYQLWPPVVSEAGDRLSGLCAAVRPWLPAALADPLCRLADSLRAVSLPFVHVSPAVSAYHADSQRYVLLQLRDRFETFRASRDACAERVAEVAFGHSASGQSEASQLKLARGLNRLCLQAVTLHEAFSKAVEQLPMSADQEVIRELAGVRDRLRQAKFNLGPGSLSAPIASQTPLDCLLQGRYQDAIKLLDQDQLLRLYCEHLAREREPMLCLRLPAEVAFEERLRYLRNDQLQVAAALQELESADSGSL